ncbi:glycerol-3-phosphate responsive antiterminator [Alkalicoccus urumqiensis]|uniref:Glycerol uptake operon antiterminator regulatory protein n=1 Tax=Alkalicoccus urumqiensis TaxID=1548213 RepID=A0A2P6MHU1_ALKUR|nr:glycerol-3-phosphate responsive antiterminator [Alkalicoccus urumqiensis]PRO65859.1 glycerol-3-phosphate responsive antiterminator [Alkalicoccus urumqiensis]
MPIPPIVDAIESQVIASVKTQTQLHKAASSRSNIVFLLDEDVFTIERSVKLLQKHHKKVFIHMDLIEGIDSSKKALTYAVDLWGIDGIISTRSSMIKYAKQSGTMAIQRLFAIDQGAVAKGIEKIDGADAVEILPGVIPKVIKTVTEKTAVPIIAGGLIENETEIHDALRAGALAVSVSNKNLWNTSL